VSRGRFTREVLNAPNLITMGRVLLIPPVLVLIDPYDPLRNFIAMALFALASVLDLVDGWLARRAGLVTVFGKFVDPLADKLMVMALLVYLVHVDAVPPWVVVVLLGRDFYISGLRLVAASEGIVIAAGEGGKLKTVCQLVGICCVIARYRYRLPFTDQYLDYHALGMALLYVSVLLSVTSAIQYTWSFRGALRERQAS
jgi:CDP-diacylglycerol--glycerol-3-phosphate 3-phosphatidyltransferase